MCVCVCVCAVRDQLCITRCGGYGGSFPQQVPHCPSGGCEGVTVVLRHTGNSVRQHRHHTQPPGDDPTDQHAICVSGEPVCGKTVSGVRVPLLCVSCVCVFSRSVCVCVCVCVCLQWLWFGYVCGRLVPVPELLGGRPVQRSGVTRHTAQHTVRVCDGIQCWPH